MNIRERLAQIRHTSFADCCQWDLPILPGALWSFAPVLICGSRPSIGSVHSVSREQRDELRLRDEELSSGAVTKLAPTRSVPPEEYGVVNSRCSDAACRW